MTTISRLIVTNGLSFNNLDFDFNQPGMNLLVGINSDDVQGDESRNGAGKSTLFQLLNHHVGSTAISGQPKDSVVNWDVNADYRSHLAWQLHDTSNYHSYQYRKDSEWGSGFNLYLGGTYEQSEAGEAGVKDVSYDHSSDCQNDVLNLMNLSVDEWNLLVNLTDTQNDLNDPFFGNSKYDKLQFFQNLYNLDYGKVWEENKLQWKANTKALNELKIQISSKLEMVEQNLANVEEQLATKRGSIELEAETGLFKSLIAAKTKEIEGFTDIAEKVARYSFLQQRLVNYPDVNISERLKAVQAYLIALQQDVSQAQQLISNKKSFDDIIAELQHYPDLSNTNITELSEKSTKLGAELTQLHNANSFVQRNQQDSSSIQENSVLSERDYLTSMEAILAASIASLSLGYSSRHTLLLTSNDILQCESRMTKVYGDMVAAYGDGVAITAGSTVTKELVQTLASEVTLVNNAIAVKNHEHMALTSKGEHCPTCNQVWQDLDITTDKLAKLVAEIADLKQTLALKSEELQKNIANRDAYLAYCQLYAEYSPLEEKYKSSTLVIASAEIGLAAYIAKLQKEVSEIQESIRLESAQRDLICRLLKYSDLQLSWLKSGLTPTDSLVSQKSEVDTLITQYNRYASLAANKAAALIANPAIGSVDIAALQESVQRQTATHQAYINEQNILSELVGTYEELISDKFLNILSIKHSFKEENYIAAKETLAKLNNDYSESLQELGIVKGLLAQKVRLESQKEEISGQQGQMKELTAIGVRHAAIDYLTGPRGLLVPKLEAIFKNLNMIMNMYLSMQVKDDSSGKKLTAWFEVGEMSPQLNVYRGDAYVHPSGLSGSEKPRVKLARTLALREFVLQSKVPNILFLDEIDGPACPVNTERMWDCVAMHSQRNPNTCIWAVSHDDSIQKSDIWTRKFKIEKRDGFSTIVQI